MFVIFYSCVFRKRNSHLDIFRQFIYFSVFVQKRLRGHIIVINFILQCPFDQNLKFI